MRRFPAYRCALRTLSATAVLLLAGVVVRAEFSSGLINNDFHDAGFVGGPGPHSAYQFGPAVIGNAGDIWSVSEFFPLQLTNGQVSGVGMKISGSVSGISGSETAFAETPYVPMMSDGILIDPNTTVVLSFSNLTPLQPYDLYFYASLAKPGANDIRTTTFSIGDVSLSATTIGAPSTFIEGNNYVHFRSQPADAAGNMRVQINGSGGDPISASALMGGIVNGFQITPVPEPNTLLLFIFGAVGWLLTTRRYLWTAIPNFNSRMTGRTLKRTLPLATLLCWLLGGVAQAQYTLKPGDLLVVGPLRVASVTMAQGIAVVNKGVFIPLTQFLPYTQGGVGGLVFDRAGNLYVALADNTIHEFAPTGADLGVFAHRGLSRPQDMIFDNSGNLFVANKQDNTVHKFGPTGADLGTFATAGLNQPSGLAFDASGNLYVSNLAEKTIHRFAPNGTDLGIFVSAPTLNQITDITFDSQGNLYAASSTSADGIHKYDPTGDDLGTFNPLRTFGLAFDNKGNLFGSGSFNDIVVADPLGDITSFQTSFDTQSFNKLGFLAFVPVPEPPSILLIIVAILAAIFFKGSANGGYMSFHPFSTSSSNESIANSPLAGLSTGRCQC